MGKDIKTEDNKYLDLILYIIGFAAIIGTPFLARLVSPLFEWVGYGSCIPFFDELFTSIFWLAEIIIIAILYSKKFGKKITFDKSKRGEELPIRRVFLISAVVIVCILIISVQIEFQVKPFYDLGEKFNGYELLNNIGIFVRNIVKCVWLVIMARAAQDFVEKLLGKGQLKLPVAGIILALTVGLYDILLGMNNLPITYFLLYFVYGWIYILTDRSFIKTYLLVMFIFLF